MGSLAPILQEYFTAYLVTQRAMSEATIRAYRDTWRLFAELPSGSPHGRVGARAGCGSWTGAARGRGGVAAVSTATGIGASAVAPASVSRSSRRRKPSASSLMRRLATSQPR